MFMPGYVAKDLQRFTHLTQERDPHTWNIPQYGHGPQLRQPGDTSPLLDPAGKLRLQEIIDTFLYYARALDSIMLVALGSLGAAQSQGTEATMEAATKLLN